MIRERIANVPEERIITMYRLWHCFDCGLDFFHADSARTEAVSTLRKEIR